MHLRTEIFHILKPFGALNILRGVKKNKVTVLCLHRVSDEFSPAWPPLKVHVFDKMLQYISRHYDVITLKDIDNPVKGKKPKLILSFDDGYKDFIENALPLLKKYNLPAVQNVTISCVETGLTTWTQRLYKIIETYYKHGLTLQFEANNIKEAYHFTADDVDLKSTKIHLKLFHVPDNLRNSIINTLEKNAPEKVIHTRMMNWDDLNECLKNNIEIGSHTMSHHNLIYYIDKKQAVYEISQSKEIIKTQLNIEPLHIAFPYSLYNDEVLEMSAKAGYKYAMVGNEQLYLPTDNNNEVCKIVPRIKIQHETFIENCFKIEHFHNYVKKYILKKDLNS